MVAPVDATPSCRNRLELPMVIRVASDVVLMGPPGPGRGRRPDRGATRRCRHVASGDLFGRAARRHTSGRSAKAYMDRGELVPTT